MKTLLIIAGCFTSYVCNAQLVEHFSDGNFASDPVWSGSTTHFIVNTSQQLQLNNTVAGTSYLTTPFDAADISGFEWEVYVKQSFAGSASNFGRIYLTSSQSNLSTALNGYYLQLGEAGSNDAVELFRQSGTTHTSICRAANAAIANAFSIRIKIKRTADATWAIFVDYAGGSSFVEAAQGVDATFASSSFLGVFCTYTIGNANRFFFDDFIGGPPLGDITPPVFQSLNVQSSSTLLLVFSESLKDETANDVNNYMVSSGFGFPRSAELQEDRKTVKLTFASPFLNGQQYVLSVDSLQDLAGNMIDPITSSFRYFVPSPAVRGDIVFNELFPDPSPVVGLPAQEFIELYNSSDKAFNLSGWKLNDLTSTSALPTQFLLPGEFIIITPTAGLPLYAGYGMTLGLTDMPTLNNTSDAFVLRDPSGTVIDSVRYDLSWYRDDDLAQGGYTLERLHPYIETNNAMNWIASESLSGGTPGAINSVFGHKLDTQPPKVDSVRVVSARELRVYFNEAMDTILLNQPGFYVIDGGYHPAQIISSSKSAALLFEVGFVNGADNYLLIDSVSDMSENIIAPTRINFRYFIPGQIKRGVVLINEIMADPTPVVLLPEAEFVEIINRSSEPFDLKNWTLSDATGTAKLPSAVIMPGDFVVLTAVSNATKFSSGAIGVTGFPSLSNSGESIVLKDPAGNVVDSVRYNVSWYTDSKRDGGWSLERLRYEFSSNWDLNWRACIDSTGGTPGRINSRFGQHPDQVPPQIISVTTLDSHSIGVGFSEPILFTGNVARIKSDSIACAGVDVVAPSAVRVSFDRDFVNGASYLLEITGVTDTASNIMEPASVTYTYFVSRPVSRKDLIISEIMADPTPIVGLPEAEYLELFNRSGNPVSVSGWQLKDNQNAVSLPGVIIPANSRIVVTSTSAATKFPGVKTLGVPGFPSLANDGESIVIADQNGVTIDSVSYSPDWYRNSEKSDGGWSLEIIDPENVCGEENNWSASEATAGGTPGLVNSIDANKPDLEGPRLLSVTAAPDSLVLTFDEKLAKSLAEVLIVLQPSSGNYSMSFADRQLRRLIVRLDDPLELSTEYKLTISNLRDCTGNFANEAFTSTKFALPEDPKPGDVVINEILFNPRPGGVDFVEIYNQGKRYIDLTGWKLLRTKDDSLSDEREILSKEPLGPLTYRVFTSDKNVLKSHYPQSVNEVLFNSILPSMPDDQGSIVVADRLGNVIDSVVYNEAMHAALLSDNEGVSLERLSFSAPSTDVSNWRSASESAGFATPGYLNSNFRDASGDALEVGISVSPEVISLHASNNFALIEYNLGEPGYYVNCRIVDLQGRMIMDLAENMTVGTEGFFRWDGVNDAGQFVVPGYYTVYFEYFNLEGEQRLLRRRVIVSPR